jgi:steroid delta-isomerase-like uncharacterized protein
VDGSHDAALAVDAAAVAERFYALVAAGRIEDAVALAAPGFLGHGLGGRDDLQRELEMWAGAFPDLDITVEDTIVEGDRVAVRMRLRGTHTGTFAGLAPSGRQFEVRCTDVVRIVDGRVAEAWPLVDLAGLLVQVGGVMLAPNRERE